ncbi:NADH dehydrogenase [ubiquinone] 1 beta subcomplex subunit 9 [Camponotus floridanus]|uniref:NADH dehydrogenase [ubiquinone] 1 beta subcomplex subunit 9 n=1 Tax=Camponotus floridanus TaxID=104421 RepID=E2AYS6_CAMFO|nr:NADH dehydrogenase [ubiquinone] 1 beta subcomplex subunit 9 [Camponotus floridanus]EFN61439.1 NADH dehydrogenase [ubiquinone] 1 beta subcomplex subunit 9 [Camponotus floridanus]
MAHLPSELVSHSQKVCSLYKRAIRCIRDWNHKIENYRIQAILMRERFDKNKDIKDMRYATYLLQEGEKELFSNQHYHPMTYPNSASGGAYGRKGETPDCVLDYWHPLEKARYPKYFARREQMKNEYEKWYFETYPDQKKTIKDH